MNFGAMCFKSQESENLQFYVVKSKGWMYCFQGNNLMWGEREVETFIPLSKENLIFLLLHFFPQQNTLHLTCRCLPQAIFSLLHINIYTKINNNVIMNCNSLDSLKVISVKVILRILESGLLYMKARFFKGKKWGHIYTWLNMVSWFYICS